MTEHQTQALNALLEALEQLTCSSIEEDHHPNVRTALRVACLLLAMSSTIIDLATRK
jgi:hypothetical protein